MSDVSKRLFRASVLGLALAILVIGVAEGLALLVCYTAFTLKKPEYVAYCMFLSIWVCGTIFCFRVK